MQGEENNNNPPNIHLLRRGGGSWISGPACPGSIGMQIISAGDSVGKGVLSRGTGWGGVERYCGGGWRRTRPVRPKSAQNYKWEYDRYKGDCGAWQEETQETTYMVAAGVDAEYMEDKKVWWRMEEWDLVHPKMSPMISFSGMYQKSFIYFSNRINSQ